LVVDVLLRRWQKYKLGEGHLAPSPELTNFLMDEIACSTQWNGLHTKPI